MDAEALKAQLVLAVKMGKELQEANVIIESKAAKLEEANIGMLKKFEALSKQIEDGGGDVKQLEEMADKIKELQSEISDVRSKAKTPAQILPEDSKKALRMVAGGAIGSFLAQKKRDGGVKSDDLSDFMTMAAKGLTDKFKELNISTPADGGLAIANVLATDVLDYARNAYPILQEIGFKSGMTRSYRQLINLGGVGVRRGSENTDGQTKINPANGKYISTETQTYAEVKSNTFQASAEPLISDHAMAAPDINIYNDLIVDLGIEVGEWMAKDVTLGNGTLVGGDGEARGILGSRLDITNTTGESWKPTKGVGRRNADVFPAYSTGVAGDIGVDDKTRVNWLMKFMRQLPVRYRMGAKLYMNENTLSVFELARDANERPVFRLTYMDGEVRLNGKPIVLDDNMPDIGVDTAFIMYGNLKLAYVINNGDVEKMQINPYIVRGATVVEYDKEMFEMIQRSDALIVGVATTNSGA
jgi:HK97 family phage major capsid protein